MTLEKIPKGDTRHMMVIPEEWKLRPHLGQLSGAAFPIQVEFADIDRHASALNYPQAAANGIKRRVLESVGLAPHAINDTKCFEPPCQRRIGAGVGR